MASTTKKSSKSVNFTADDADQDLLREVESVIGEGQYASFSDLCKDALEQFLFPDAATPPGGESMDVSRLEQQLVQIQTQLASLASLQSEHDVSSLSQLEGQLLHLAQQLEQIDESTRQIPDQLQQQYESLESLVTGQSGSSDGSQVESQLTRLGQQLKQLDSKTSQTLSQLQDQLATLEGGFSAQSGVVDGSGSAQLENQLVELTDQIEKLTTKMSRAIKDLQQQITDLNVAVPESAVASEEFSTEELTAQLESHVTNLTERINWVDAKSEERLMQLQRQIAELTQSLATREDQHGEQRLVQLQRQIAELTQSLATREDQHGEKRLAQLQGQITELTQSLATHEAQYLAKVEEHFAQLVEKMETSKAKVKRVAEPEADEEEEDIVTPSGRSSVEDPLLSRLSSLIEDF